MPSRLSDMERMAGWLVPRDALKWLDSWHGGWTPEAIASEFVNGRFPKIKGLVDMDLLPVAQNHSGHQELPEERRTRQWEEARKTLWEQRYLRLVASLKKLWKRHLSEADKNSINETMDFILSDRRIRGRSPAFQLHVGEQIFTPRDPLDCIAFVIMYAHRRGLLRTCKGQKRGYECNTPLLVARENRNTLCAHCAVESTRRSMEASRERRRKREK